VEERSSKRPRPSGDWKPYKRDDAQGEAEEKPKPSGDWKTYDRDKGQVEAGESEAKAPEAEPKQEDRKAESPDEEEKRSAVGAEDEQSSEQRPRDEERSEQRPRDEQRSEHEPSGVDAMGQDKHREVTGQRYGLSRGRQVLYYGVFVAFVIAAYIGLKAATDSLDKAPAKDPDQAPWSKPNAPGGPLGGFTPKTQDPKGATDFQ